MIPRLLRFALSVAAALAFCTVAPATVQGQGSDTPTLSVRGFGTVGFVHSSEDQADFAGSPLRPNGPGASHSLSPDVDSRIGVQASAVLVPKLTAVVQLVAEQTAADDYMPGLEWAYADYAFTEDLSLRAGRMPVATFLVSDFRKVSYANVWMRPPVELYSLSPVSRGEAVEASHRFDLGGGWNYTAQASYGRSTGEFRGFEGTEESAEAHNVWSTNHTFQRGGLSGRLLFARGQLDIPAFDPFFDVFRLFGPEGEAIADRYAVDDAPFTIATLGVEYDAGRWFGVGEFAWADFNSVLGEKLGGYLTGGARFGALTPYVTYSLTDLVSESTADGLSTEGLPPEQAAGAENLNVFLDLFLQGAPRQQNLAVGGRWDVRPGVALKAQVDFIDVFEDSPGTFINWQPGFEPGGSARLLSLSVAFVF